MKVLVYSMTAVVFSMSGFAQAETDQRLQTILKKAEVWCSDGFADISDDGQVQQGGAFWAADSLIGEIPIKLISEKLARKSVSTSDGRRKYELRFDASAYTVNRGGLKVELQFTDTDPAGVRRKVTSETEISSSILKNIAEGKSGEVVRIVAKVNGDAPEQILDEKDDGIAMVRQLGLTGDDFIFHEVSCTIEAK